VAFQMIDGEERLVVCKGHCLGGHHAHHHATDQPRPPGRGDAVEVAEPEPGLRERLGHQPIDPLEMSPRGDLGHHAAEAAVLGQLAVDHVRENTPDRGIARHIVGWRLDHGDRRLVAARFDTQDAHARLLASGGVLR
jgi:hypothetical protein